MLRPVFVFAAASEEGCASALCWMLGHAPLTRPVLFAKASPRSWTAGRVGWAGRRNCGPAVNRARRRQDLASACLAALRDGLPGIRLSRRKQGLAGLPGPGWRAAAP